MAPSYCTFAVLVLDPNDNPVVGVTVEAYPANEPLLRQMPSQYGILEPGHREFVTDSTGTAAVALPWASETNPTTTTWIIQTPNRKKYAGPVPSIAGPIDLQTAMQSYGWAPVSTTQAVVVEQGPPGMVNRGTWSNLDTYAINDAVSYNGGYFIAVAINGPQNGGAVTPGTNSAVWQTVAQAGYIATSAPANQVYAGPASGSPAAPTLRPLVPTDVPALPPSQITGTAVINTDPRLTDTRTPTDGTVTDAKVASNAAIAESKLALASDAAANIASRRTLGTGAQQATAGNDARLSDARTPTAHAATHGSAGTDPVALDASQVTTGMLPSGVTVQDASIVTLSSSKLAGLIAAGLLPAATTTTQGAAVKTATYLSDYASLAAALAALGTSTPAHLVIHQSQTAVPTATIPSNITLEFRNGATLQPANAATITHNGAIIAPPVQIFDTSLGGSIKLSPVHIHELWVDWFGAKADSNGNSGNGTDSTAGIQAAYNASTSGTGIVVRFTGGTYRVTSSITLLSSLGQCNVVSRGTGGRQGGAGLTKAGTIIAFDVPTSTFNPLGNWIGVWASNTQYQTSNVVRDLNNGNYYAANNAVKNTTPPSSDGGVNWTLTTEPTWGNGNLLPSTATGHNQGKPWAANTAYGIAQVVLYSGHYYVTLQAIDNTHSTTPNLDTTNYGNADPLFLALSRLCVWEGIGFTGTSGNRIFSTFFVDWDMSVGGIDATKNKWVDCWFGGWGSQHVTYGMVVGLFNQSNTDQMYFDNCEFTDCDWAGLAVPNSTQQSKEHHFHDCDFTAYGTPQSPYALWAATGSFHFEDCHFYNYVQYAQLIGQSWEDITNINNDAEGCAGFGKYAFGQGNTALFIGGRYTKNSVPLVAPATGKEFINVSGGGSLTSIGTDWGDGYSTTTLFNIGNNMQATFINCSMPNPTPMTGGNTYRVIFQNCTAWGVIGQSNLAMPDQITQNGTPTSYMPWQISGVPVVVNGSAPQPFTLTDNPPPIPTQSSNSSTGGALRGGTAYTSYFTYVTAVGETSYSTSRTAMLGGNINDGHTWQQNWINLGLGPAGTTSRNVYRRATIASTTLAAQANAGQNQATLQTGQGANWVAGDWMELVSGGTHEGYQLTNVTGDVVTFASNLVNTYPVNSTVDSPYILAATIANNTATTWNDTAAGTYVTGQRPASDTSSIKHVGLGVLTVDVVTSTSASAGTNGAVPSQVSGYITATINGTSVKIPYFAN